MKYRFLTIFLCALFIQGLQAQNPALLHGESSIQNFYFTPAEPLSKKSFLRVAPGNNSGLISKTSFSSHSDVLVKADSVLTIPQLLIDDFLRGVGGFTNAFIQPIKWEKDDWIIAGGVALGTFALYTFDQESTDFFTRNKQNIPGIVREMGSAATPERFFMFNGAIYLGGILTKNEDIRDMGVLLLTSSTAASLMLATGKWAIGRARPYTGEGKAAFDHFSSSEDWHSFPSGHSLLSVTTAYAIGKKIKNPWFKAGIYTMGMVAPVSRLWEGAHWLTDVGLSIALGVAVVEGVDNYLNRLKEQDESGQRIKWDFHLGLGAMGITAKF